MERINPAEWKRKPLSDFFGGMDFPFYNVTFRVDVTHLYEACKARNLSIYHSTIWASMRAMNSVDAFLYKLRGDWRTGNDVVKHDFLSPSFTESFQEELFKIIHMDWIPGEALPDFCVRAKELAAGQTTFLGGDETQEQRDDLVYISCLPWLDFMTMTNEMSFDRSDSIPRISWGKIVTEGDRKKMTFAIQVNHRLVDGRQLGMFGERLQGELDGI